MRLLNLLQCGNNVPLWLPDTVMKILIDQNISFRVVQRVIDSFPQIEHVRDIGLMEANDYHIFMAARSIGFQAVLTQDEDFYNLLLEHGCPPKVIRLRTGNCSTSIVTQTLLQNVAVIQSFIEDSSRDFLEIYA